jgi:hypothetical protein
MRSVRLALVLVFTFSAAAFAQPVPQGKPTPQPPPDRPAPAPVRRCCAPKVVDRNGKVLGEIMHYDDRMPSFPHQAWVRYELKPGGDAVMLNVGAEAIFPWISLGGSAVVFTSIDCTGNAFVAAMGDPTLTKRYAVVLPQGGASPGPWAATHAWLYVTDPFPTRVNAGATLWRSQWDFSNACVPYPAPGLTFAGDTWGFFMHKVEDLYAKYKRPFWIQ